MIVLIVTPTRNIEKHLDRTINSVVSQLGNFRIYYHIQDSRSSDSTISKVKEWEDRIKNSQDNLVRSNIYFSWESEEDSGMYDAINKGFNYLLEKNALSDPGEIIMTWINGDDILPSGSLKTITSFFKETDFTWATGVPSLIREDDCIIDLRDSPCCFSRLFLERGLHDGRSFHFVQQEGTFWRKTLWQSAGPLNHDLKLAGDWDLWRRFAKHAELVTLRATLGFHRRHSNQLSNAIESYYQEVDKILGLDSDSLLYSDQLLTQREDRALVARWSEKESNWIISQDRVIPMNSQIPPVNEKADPVDEGISDRTYSFKEKIKLKVLGKIGRLKSFLARKI